MSRSCVLHSPTANFHSVISLNISPTDHLPVFLVHGGAHKRIESGRKITLFISYHVMKPFQHMKLLLIRIILDFFLPLGKKKVKHTIESPLRQAKCSL